MGMPLTNEQLEDLGEYVRAHIGQWLADASLAKPPAVYEIELRERMIRMEGELKHQRELMKQGFDLMEKRFEAVDKRFEDMNKRFEATDKRFEIMDKRFETMDKRFETLTQRIDRFMFWSFGTTIGAAFMVITALKILL